MDRGPLTSSSRLLAAHHDCRLADARGTRSAHLRTAAADGTGRHRTAHGLEARRLNA
jgi:hypothetical protein